MRKMEDNHDVPDGRTAYQMYRNGLLTEEEWKETRRINRNRRQRKYMNSQKGKQAVQRMKEKDPEKYKENHKRYYQTYYQKNRDTLLEKMRDYQKNVYYPRKNQEKINE